MTDSSKSWTKRVLPHLVALFLFIAVPYIYFWPLLTGQQVQQHDRDQWAGTAQELVEYSKTHDGEQSHWTNTVFSGMPSTLISLHYEGNMISYLDDFLTIGRRPASYLMLMMIGFYLLMLIMGVNPWLAIVSAIAYGFSTYFFIIVGAGHNAKLHAMAYTAPMIGGAILALRGRHFSGCALFAIALALSLVCGHPQVTYYALMIVGALVIGKFIETIRSAHWKSFGFAILALAIGTILASGANFNRLYQTWDYGKESIRYPSALKDEHGEKSSGLDRSYATAWSYGKAETLNLFVPNLVGGSSMLPLDDDSHVAKFLDQSRVPANQKQILLKGALPLYWGPQPMTSGPVYLGAVVVFLFVFSLFLFRDRKKYWLLFSMLGITLVALLLSWGHNLDWFHQLFFDHFPYYNKFRAVSTILLIVEFTVPFIAFWGLNELLQGKLAKRITKRALTASLLITGGAAILIALFAPGIASFKGAIDDRLLQMGYPDRLIEALRADRFTLLRDDAIRSFIFVILAGGAVLLYRAKKIKELLFAIILVLLVGFDMWPVDERYDGVTWVTEERNADPFTPTKADREIMQDTSYYRVYNLTVSPFNDASTSYFHNSVGGYHGAKMRRYQDFIDRYADSPVMRNLLNVKYLIVANEQGQPVVRRNIDAFGNVWMVDSVRLMQTPDEEINMLRDVNLKNVALIQHSQRPDLTGITPRQPGDTIYLTTHEINALGYRSEASGDRFVVFSEIFYPRGWVATIDDQTVPLYQVDYMLRGLRVPAGVHDISMRFELPMYWKGVWLDRLFGFLLYGMVAVWAVLMYLLAGQRKDAEKAALQQQ